MKMKACKADFGVAEVKPVQLKAVLNQQLISDVHVGGFISPQNLIIQRSSWYQLKHHLNKDQSLSRVSVMSPIYCKRYGRCGIDETWILCQQILVSGFRLFIII